MVVVLELMPEVYMEYMVSKKADTAMLPYAALDHKHALLDILYSHTYKPKIFYFPDTGIAI